MGMTPDDMAVWDFDQPQGGLTKEEIRRAKIILWKGFCSVHQMFRPEHIRAFREKHPDGFVISHPECCEEVCALSDEVGSTEYIIKTIAAAPPNTRWLVGTELNLVCNESPKNSSHRGKLSNSCRRLFACAARWRALTRNIWLGV